MPRVLFVNPLTDGAGSAWLDAAERVADILREDIVERDAAGASPHYAIELLREHDLLNLVIPARLGGAGEPWSTAAGVTRIIARTDAGIAHALGYHYTWVWFVCLYATPTGDAIVRRSAAGSLFWASIGSAFGGTGSITADADGYAISAERGFATGAPLADILFTQTVSSDDGLLYLSAVLTSAEGVAVADDWDVVGQRLSASTGITLTDVHVTAHDVVTTLPAPGAEPAPIQSLMIPSFQLLFGYLNLGIAEGALFEARDYVLASGRPWIHSGVAAAADDPHIRALFGEHAARASGVAAQLGAASAVLSALFEGTIATTPTTRGQVAELIAAAKVVSQRAALDASTAVFDATGARSTGAGFGLDRFWRNARTLSLHDPIAYKLTEIGDHVLTGALPEPSVYR